MAKGDPRLLGWLAHTYRLWLVLEGEHHGLREVGDLGVRHNNTQDLLTQDLARILVLDMRWGERREGLGAEKEGPEVPRALQAPVSGVLGSRWKPGLHCSH